MTTLQAPSALIIDVAKIRDYLLNRAHPVGRAKAAFFLSCGFKEGRPEELADSLFEHASAGHVARSMQTPFGAKWVFEGPMKTPSGPVPAIRSVWIVRQNTSVGELVTAYKV
ncbi:hypothetical protein RHAL1_03420 [Beijerinckiaceae bacterium RH AL1]|nr:hypothetical protein [Beijerinckiaceae bacterium]VVB48635.1 hypothetical protein RHCH11_RHCH11_03354 [Beijerinckiaceae bacterium RH CH11]VVB48716.1 hypothetical protein RHAL8_03350 [Beijerinckiaceae bacterium RH AL8]VVC56493.1 hypothetical protein RHAL1_03420 [Beijerinckiaceae bacterium RH AL1]